MSKENSKRTDISGSRNVIALPDRTTIKEEAARWLVKLDQGSLSSDEISNLKTWAAQSRQHRYTLEQMCSTWDKMGALQHLAELFPLSEIENGKQQSSFNTLSVALKSLKGLFQPTFATAAVLVAVLGCLLAFSGMLLPTKNTYSTGVGEQHNLTLSDGTHIFLNTDSRITVDYEGERRVIVLDYGEANFDVAKNPERPFVVYAGEGLVWAVGTAFNVRHVGKEVDVTVTEGQVKVFSNKDGYNQYKNDKTKTLPAKALSSTSETPQTLNRDSADLPKYREALIGAGQSLRYGETIKKVAKMDDEEQSRKLAWQQGSLIFKGETLKQAVAEINRYSTKEIRVSDALTSELKVGGHYKTDDIDTLIASLQDALDLRVHYTQDDTILLSSNSPRP